MVDCGKLIVAPVTITPTKPLTPTHVKGLLWTDVLVKASTQIADTQLVWNPRLAHLTTQTTAFWHYLDRTEPAFDWSGESESAIGARYVRFHHIKPIIPAAELDPYFDRVERTGWIHPSARRMLELWRAELDLLHVPDPGLTDPRPLAWSTRTVLDALARRDLIIDHRGFGGPAYLDGARWGMPIRQLVGPEGHGNYLLPILRELLPRVVESRLVLLLHDCGVTSDFLLLERVLREFGATVVRLGLSRVSTDGTTRSSRYGGWAGSTLADISATPGSAGADAYRLGMRLYFVGLLDRRSSQSFRMDLLRRCVGRAARLLNRRPAVAEDPDERHLALLRSLAVGGYVDPHRLTTSLLRTRTMPMSATLAAVYQ